MTERILHDGLIDREVLDKYPYPMWFEENAHRKEVKYLNIILSAFWIALQNRKSVTVNEVLEMVNSKKDFKTDIVTESEVKECLDLSHFYGAASVKQLGDIISYELRSLLPTEDSFLLYNSVRAAQVLIQR